MPSPTRAEPRPRTLADRERNPTGKPSNPVVLLSGEEFTGKTYQALQFTGSGRVGRSWLIQLGESDGDQYGGIPGARHKILDHDGTWPDVLATVEAAIDGARQAAADGELPPVLIFDSMSKLWELLTVWAENRARSTNQAKDKIARDPNTDIAVSPTYWNAANRRHRYLMTRLRSFPGIVILTCRGKWVTKVDAKGEPTKEKEYTVEAQKELGFRVSAWVRLSRGAVPQLVGMRQAVGGVTPYGDNPVNLGRDFTVESFIFDTLGFDPNQSEERRETPPVADAAPDPEFDDPMPTERPPLGAEATLSRRPSQRAAQLATMIETAVSRAELRPVWTLIGPAVDHGEISRAEGHHLQGMFRSHGENLPETVEVKEPAGV